MGFMLSSFQTSVAKLRGMSMPPSPTAGPHATGLQEPPFWDDFLGAIPFCQLLEEKHLQILDELKQFVLTDKPFMDYPKYGNLYSNSWEAFPLSIFEGELIEMAKGQLGFDLEAFVAHARLKLPRISDILTPLESEGHLRNVFVSRLLPGSVIHPHRGWTSNFLRIHLGLICDPLCAITVGPRTQTWSVGKLLSFKDGGAYLHSVRHRGSHERIVMSVDLRLSYLEQFIPGITKGSVDPARASMPGGVSTPGKN